MHGIRVHLRNIILGDCLKSSTNKWIRSRYQYSEFWIKQRMYLYIKGSLLTNSIFVRYF